MAVLLCKVAAAPGQGEPGQYCAAKQQRPKGDWQPGSLAARAAQFQQLVNRGRRHHQQAPREMW